MAISKILFAMPISNNAILVQKQLDGIKQIKLKALMFDIIKVFNLM